MTRHAVVSLFSGGMGLDLGLAHTGRFVLHACVEKIPAFRATILANRAAGHLATDLFFIYGQHQPDDGDVAHLDPLRVLADQGLRPGDLALLSGGPPCQSFSTAGRRAGTSDPRGTMLWQFLRWIEAMRPRFFLMENVRGLVSAALGPGVGRGSVLARFLHDLPPEYRVDAFEVNAVNYGAPQLRERLLLVGNRAGHVVEFPAPTHGTDRPFRTLGDALAGLVDTDPAILDFSPRKKGYLTQVPPGGNWRSLPEAVARASMGRAYEAKGGRSGWWRRLSMDLPCPTLVTLPNHASTSLCHPTETRALSLREYARIQEFPDDWAFHGTLQERYVQVGNAVPVRLGEVAGRCLAEHLDAPDERHGAVPSRLVYLRSHIRTRAWFKDGQAVVREDDAHPVPDARTQRRVTAFVDSA